MSKRTIALIIGLFAVTAILVLVAIYDNPTAKKAQQTSVVTVSPKQTILGISQEASPSAVATPSAISSNSANLNILTGKNKVTGVQIELSYDPKVLTNVDIIPGTFFTNPATLIKDIDKEKGLITYALVISPGESGVMGTGIVARLTFETLATSSATTTIKFLPKTQVAAEGIAISVLKNAVNGNLTIKPNAQITPAPTTGAGTPSAQ